MSEGAPRFVVTGASGWVGQAVLHTLKHRLGRGWAGRVKTFGSTERRLPTPAGLAPQRALESLRPADVEGAYVLHLAFLGREKGGADEAAFRAANRAIDAEIAAALRQVRPAGLFVSSSGAAKMAETGVDRHAYGLAKLEQEALFADLAAATGAATLIGRIYNLAGPHMNKLESYALSAFLLQARDTGVIRIEATRPVYRAYLHALDLAALVIGALKAGEGWDGPKDLCGMTAVEMQDVALAAAKAAGLPASALRRGSVDLQRPSVYLGDPVHTRTLALGLGLTLESFETQVRDTARWLGVGRNSPAR
jgi:nucleoside-diphosphate-sugar epimerase